jgi:hypothetical protein
MINLLEFPNSDQLTPYLIKGIRRVPGKGIVLTNEYGKLLAFIEEPDERVIRVWARAIKQVVEAGRRFVQPDWEALRAAALAQRADATPTTSPTGTPSVVSDTKKPANGA